MSKYMFIFTSLFIFYFIRTYLRHTLAESGDVKRYSVEIVSLFLSSNTVLSYNNQQMKADLNNDKGTTFQGRNTVINTCRLNIRAPEFLKQMAKKLRREMY